MHPSFLGSPVAVWFLDGEPVRLVVGGRRLRVIAAQPSEAPRRGAAPQLRVVARLESGRAECLDLRQEGAGWVLAGIRAVPASASRR